MHSIVPTQQMLTKSSHKSRYLAALSTNPLYLLINYPKAVDVTYKIQRTTKQFHNISMLFSFSVDLPNQLRPQLPFRSSKTRMRRVPGLQRSTLPKHACRESLDSNGPLFQNTHAESPWTPTVMRQHSRGCLRNNGYGRICCLSGTS